MSDPAIEHTVELTISLPPEAVFAFLTQAENYPRWDPACLEMVPEAPGPWHPGLRFQEVRMGLGKMKVQTELTALVANQRLATRSLSGPAYTGEWRLEPRDEGRATWLQFRGRLELDMLMQFVAPMVRDMFVGQLDASLPRLKQVLEAT